MSWMARVRDRWHSLDICPVWIGIYVLSLICAKTYV